MTAQAIRNASWRAEIMQDVVLVSSFGLWALLIGVMPVAAFHLLLGS